MKLVSALAPLLTAACVSIYTPIHDARRTDDIFRDIRPGMTEAQVAQMIGRPDETMFFPLSGHDSWSYQYYDTWGYMAEFSVTFGTDHLVYSKYSRRITDGGDHGGSK